MTKVFPDQLVAQLKEGLRGCYLLIGSDPLLHLESQDTLLAAAQLEDFVEHHHFVIDQYTDWQQLFSECQALSLFAQRQVFIIQLPENGPNAGQAEQLATLTGLLHADLLLIMHGAKLTKAQENSLWYKNLASNSVIVPCVTPDHQQLPRWLQRRCQAMGMQIDAPSVQLLCYCYEGNLLALSQALARLALIWPEGQLTLPRVETAVNDAAHFTPFHWLDALLAGKSQRALHILQQLSREGTEPVILLRTVQKEVMTLLELERLPTDGRRTTMDKLRIWQNRRALYTSALQRLNRRQLRIMITQLLAMELALKQDYSTDSWPAFETLTLLFCQPRPLPMEIEYV